MVNFSKPKYAQEYCSLFHGSKEDEAFVFFTDPHLFQKNEFTEEDMFRRAESYLTSLRDTYYSIPANFVICGGDWLGSGDTIPEAKGKLGMISGFMREMFGDEFYPILGNHDSDYQGVDENGEQLGVNRGLSPEIQTNLQFRKFGHPYYRFDGLHTRFFVLDSQLDWNATEMNGYKWEQLNWLAGELLKDACRHNVIAVHMWWWYRQDSPTGAMTKALTELISAYNRKTAYDCNGTVYDFAETTGRIEFVMSGHTHADWSTVIDDCPVFSTTCFRGSEPTYDLMYADYDERKLYCVRAGCGESRVFAL